MTMDATEQIQAFIASIQLTPIATVLTDPRARDNPIIAVNMSFEQLSGHAAAQVVGLNCRLLRGADTEPEASAKLRQAVIDGAAAIVELLNYRRDGIKFRNAVMIAPIYGDDGAPLLFVGSQMEVPNSANGPERRILVAKARLGSLTPRQRDVLKLMARGRLNKQIAYELGIADKTVKMHRAALLDALNAPTSADAIRLAVGAGL